MKECLSRLYQRCIILGWTLIGNPRKTLTMDTTSCFALFFSLLAGWPTTPTKAANILLLPTDHPAHVKTFSRAGGFLQSAGHNVSVLTNQMKTSIVKKQNVTSLFTVDLPIELQMGSNFKRAKDLFFTGSVMNMPAYLRRLTDLMTLQCEQTLANKKLMDELLSAQFDLAIVDSIDMFRCIYMVPYKLNVPYISMSERYGPWELGISAMPSVEPPWPVMYFNTKTSSFLERLKSLIIYSIIQVMSPFPMDESLIKKYVPEKPHTTFWDLYMNSEMWLVATELMCLDTARVSAPHVRFIEGIADEPAQPLPSHLESIFQEAEHGVILTSFGSIIREAPQVILQKLMNAFVHTKFQVIMRLDGQWPGNVPSNVHFEKWLPQNDLLGHKKTVLFITHGGMNGQMEGLYQGVPMLVMPFALDQFANAMRLVDHGYGRTLDPYSFTSEQLLAEIEEMTQNSTYRDKIQRCSRIHRHLTKPAEELRHYVDHVLEFGGKHLHPNHLGQPVWKLLMFDVFAFLVFVGWILYKLVSCVVFCIVKSCAKADVKKKVQ